MTDIRRLIAEHDHLERLAARLEQCALGPNSLGADAIALKMMLAVALTEHLAHEDDSLYAPLLAGGPSALVGQASELRLELAALRDDWAAYLDEWSDDAVEQDWDGFASQTRMLMSRLRTRIARENNHLIPMALQNSTLRLRAA